MMDERYYENHKFENIKMDGELLENYEFIECEFENCIFEECVIQNCMFIGCRFSNCNIISIRAEYSQMKYSEFAKCNLIGINWHDLLPAGRIIEPVQKLTDCFLKYNSFINMSFMKFKFCGNVIQDSTFDECNIRESNFKGCRLEATQFSKCDMRKADFREAIGYLIDIYSNKMKEAKFSFPEVVNLLSGLGIKID